MDQHGLILMDDLSSPQRSNPESLSHQAEEDGWRAAVLGTVWKKILSGGCKADGNHSGACCHFLVKQCL